MSGLNPHESHVHDRQFVRRFLAVVAILPVIAFGLIHQAGVRGAPRIDDSSAWKQRLAAAGGEEGLVRSAEQGKNQMPPKGGRPDLTEADIRAAVDAMLRQSGA